MDTINYFGDHPREFFFLQVLTPLKSGGSCFPFTMPWMFTHAATYLIFYRLIFNSFRNLSAIQIS